MRMSDLHNPAAAAELFKQFKKRYSTKVCMHPQRDCEGQIVAAHTLSLSSMLRPLSRDNKVYALKANLPPGPGEDPMVIALRGVRETSTFNGFCQKHDKALFSPIEDAPIACQRQQMFLFAYRAVAKEAYLKRKQAESMPSPDEIQKIHGIDRELIFSDQAVRHLAASFQGAEEVERLKARLDRSLLAGDFGRLVTTVFEFSQPPPIAASFVYAPDYDFEGNELQDFYNFDVDLSNLMVTLLPTPAGGFLFLSYEDTANSAPRRLVESLKGQEDVTSAILWLIACQTENFAIAPDWFDALSADERQTFKEAFFANADPFNMSVNNLRKRKLSTSSWLPKTCFTL